MREKSAGAVGYTKKIGGGSDGVIQGEFDQGLRLDFRHSRWAGGEFPQRYAASGFRNVFSPGESGFQLQGQFVHPVRPTLQPIFTALLGDGIGGRVEK